MKMMALVVPISLVNLVGELNSFAVEALLVAIIG
jgi:hypothetical protein